MVALHWGYYALMDSTGGYMKGYWGDRYPLMYFLGLSLECSRLVLMCLRREPGLCRLSGLGRVLDG